MPSTYTPYLNIEIPGYDEQDETWGATAGTGFETIDAAIEDANTKIATTAAQSAPSGLLGYFARSTAPAGWIKARAGYIGNAASGADIRANADTEALWKLWYAEFPTLVLLTNTGGATTRTTVDADYAAGKRMPVFDERDQFSRGWKDDLVGGKSGNLLEVIADAMQRIDAVVGNVIRWNASTYGASAPFSTGSDLAQQPGTDNGTFRIAPLTFDTGSAASSTAGLRSAAETRPMNTAKLACWKL